METLVVNPIAVIAPQLATADGLGERAVRGMTWMQIAGAIISAISESPDLAIVRVSDQGQASIKIKQILHGGRYIYLHLS